MFGRERHEHRTLLLVVMIDLRSTTIKYLARRSRYIDELAKV